MCIYTVFLEIPNREATLTTESFILNIPSEYSDEIISLFLFTA